MAGAILSPDQAARINAAFPALVGHIRSLLTGDHTAVGLMEVHSMVESLNTDYLAKLFTDLSYLSPVQKKALVRAALYHVVTNEPELFRGAPAPEAPVVRPVTVDAASKTTFTPVAFRLNVNKSEAFRGTPPADTSAAKPVVTSTHTSKVAQSVQAGNQRMAEYADKIEANVAEALSHDAAQQARRESVARLQDAVKPIEVKPAPAAPIDIPQVEQ